MELSLTKLRYLVTVARAQSFSRAAEFLHVSQPALSRAITELEQDYGVRIFDRSRSGTAPTPVGMQIVAEAEELLRTTTTFQHNSRLLARGERGDFHLGLGPAIAHSIFADLARMLTASHPAINLHTTIRSSDLLVRYLMTEAIEIFISAPEHVELPAAIQTRVIGHFQGGFYVRAGHPLLSRSKPTLQETLQYPLASARPTSLLPLAGRKTAMIVCDNYTLVHELVRMSDAVCISTRRTAEQEVEAGTLALLTPVDFRFEPSEVVVARIAGRTMSPLAEQVVDYCSQWLAATR